MLSGVPLCWALLFADQLTTAPVFLPQPQRGCFLGWIIGTLQNPAQPERRFAAVPPPAAPAGLILLLSGGLTEIPNVCCSHRLRGDGLWMATCSSASGLHCSLGAHKQGTAHHRYRDPMTLSCAPCLITRCRSPACHCCQSTRCVPSLTCTLAISGPGSAGARDATEAAQDVAIRSTSWHKQNCQSRYTPTKEAEATGSKTKGA